METNEMYEMTEEEYEQMKNRVFKGKSLLETPENYTLFDLETTGLSSDWDEIIEIAALKVRNNEIVDTYQQLIKPKYRIPEFITEINHITNDMVKNSPNIVEALKDFLSFAADDIMIGHNVNFDINFIYSNAFNCYGQWFTNNFVDTMRLSRNIFKNERHHRLKDLVDRFKLVNEQEHRALSDCETTKQVYDILVDYIKTNNIEFKKAARPHRPHKKYDYKNIQATVEEFDEDNPFFQKTVVFTGKLEKYVRKDAAQIVLNCGGSFKNSISKDVDFLVVGDTDYREKTIKMIKAYNLQAKGFDIEVIPESLFYEMLEEN